MATALAFGSGAVFLAAGSAYVAARSEYQTLVWRMGAKREARRRLSRLIDGIEGEQA